MMSALMIIVSLSLLVILYSYLAYILYTYSKRFIKIEQDKNLNSYQLDVLNELLSKNKSELTLESLMDTLISSLQVQFDYDVASYMLVKKDEFTFKSFIKNPVGANYVRECEHLCFDYIYKYFKNVGKVSEKPVQEYISGHVLSADQNQKPNSYFRLPVRYRGKRRGVLLVSVTNTNIAFEQEKKQSLQLLKSSTFFLEKMQNLTGVGVIRDGYVNGLVHDLRTPLVVISGTSDVLIKRNKKLTQKDKLDMYQEVKRGAKRALTIVNNLLDIAKIESGKVEVHPRIDDISKFITAEAESFRGIVEERGLKYKIETSKKSLNAYFDKDVTARILDNLISNAIKYTNEGEIIVGCKKGKKMITVYVKDTGIGIKKSEFSLLFNKFEQLANPVYKKHKGTGLGLVISKELVHAQGGKIELSSRIGVGSTFSFTVPLTN